MKIYTSLKFIALILVIFGPVLSWGEEIAANHMECEERRLQLWQPLSFGVDHRCRLVLPTMLDRSYIFCLSSRLRNTDSEPVPLVLAFHGGGKHANAGAFQARAQWEKSGFKYDFAVAYLNGCRVDISKREVSCDGGSWNARSSEQRGSCELCGIDDISFVDQVIADIQNKYLIKSDKIFAVGHSKGGMFAYSLACDRSYMLAGIGVTAAVLTRQIPKDCQPNDGVAIFHVHNLRDPVVPFKRGGIDPDFSYPPASLGLKYWLHMNGCILFDKEHDFKKSQCVKAVCPPPIQMELCLLNEVGSDPAIDPVIAHRYETYDAAFSEGDSVGQSIREAFVERFLK